MAIQKTFVMIKPDGVRRKLVGEIVARIERKGLRIAAMKMVKIDKEKANKLYEEHMGKSFFNELVSYITSGPVVCMVIEGDEAVKVMRTLIGATDPKDASPGTIRGDFALSKAENVIHASDAEEKAKREMSLFFSQNEIIE
ncbi:nucleoside-diphosphate kinase [Metallosphaera javensis (ex Sakai et al. 2022)]|uniref:nucleoside-diphosphate kinase n=1 Tax=Metallosphaera javensis (ex Sakai et al. 2022) TaxID=2775498 RepID=UPI002590FCB6|nr:MAG: nucleoside-diphosphate kinase [Metallosphaera javensis (ex Sakai et al. 2022)]